MNKEEQEAFDSAKLQIFEEHLREVGRVVDYDFERLSYPQRIKSHDIVKKELVRLQAYLKEVSKRSPTPFNLVRQIKELIKKGEALKLEMKEHIDK